MLRLQPEIRGGRKKKVKRNETLVAGLWDRLQRWNEGQVDGLWSEACKLYGGGARQAVTNSMANNIRRATECAQDARYGKAVASLLSLGTCPVTEESLKEMKSKHPEAVLTVSWCAGRWMGFPRVPRQGSLEHGPSSSRTFWLVPTKLLARRHWSV